MKSTTSTSSSKHQKFTTAIAIAIAIAVAAQPYGYLLLTDLKHMLDGSSASAPAQMSAAMVDLLSTMSMVSFAAAGIAIVLLVIKYGFTKK